MKLLVAIALTLALANAVPLYKVGSLSFTSEVDALFERFKADYAKAYYDEHDESFRKSVFAANLNKIRSHNAEADAGKHTYTLGMNEFGDMTWEEFHARYTGFNRNASLEEDRPKKFQDLSHVKVAESVDWVESGAVTGVKNQGSCGSCWSFSSTGGVEGAWFLAKNQLVSLSEQQLMDCSKAEGNKGCEGGLMDNAFKYYVNTKGACTEESYPYEMKDHFFCQSSCEAVATIDDYSDVEQSEEGLAKALSQQPVSVAIEADQDAFQLYKDGVMTGTCGTKLDHGVLAVGYGSMGENQYWKVKNSWGTSWGMDGYILLEKGKDQEGGQCGILLSASYPVVN